MRLRERFSKSLGDARALDCEDLGDGVDLLLCHPLYNIRRQQDLQNDDHDVFSAKDMDAFRDFAEYVLIRGEHENNFCFAVEIASRCRCFCARMEVLKDDIGEAMVLEVMRTTLFYNREHDNYLQDLLLKRLHRTKEVEQAIQLLHNGLLFNSLLARVCYDASEEMKSTHCGWASRILKLLRLLQAKRVFRAMSRSTGPEVSLRPDLKNMLRMTDIILKFASAAAWLWTDVLIRFR